MNFSFFERCFNPCKLAKLFHKTTFRPKCNKSDGFNTAAVENSMMKSPSSQKVIKH